MRKTKRFLNFRSQYWHVPHQHLQLLQLQVAHPIHQTEQFSQYLLPQGVFHHHRHHLHQEVLDLLLLRLLEVPHRHHPGHEVLDLLHLRVQEPPLQPLQLQEVSLMLLKTREVDQQLQIIEVDQELPPEVEQLDQDPQKKL